MESCACMLITYVCEHALLLQVTKCTCILSIVFTCMMEGTRESPIHIRMCNVSIIGNSPAFLAIYLNFQALLAIILFLDPLVH